MAEQAPPKETPPEQTTEPGELTDEDLAKVAGGQLPDETAYQKWLPPGGHPSSVPQFPRWPADSSGGRGVSVDPAVK